MFTGISTENEAVSRLVLRRDKMLTYRQIRGELMENLRAVCLTKDHKITRVHVYLHTLTGLPVN
jgi:hypothetical protein